MSEEPDDIGLEEHTQEVLKLYFEYFKHLTTLIAASAVATVVIYQETGLGISAAVYPLLCFAVSGLFAIDGMQRTMYFFSSGEDVRHWHIRGAPRIRIPAMGLASIQYWSMRLFALGVTLLVILAI